MRIASRDPGVLPSPGAGVVRVHREAGLTGARWLVKSTLAGKLAASLYRRRRVPRQALRSALRARRERAEPHAHPPGSAFPALALLMAGPGESRRLPDTLASIERYAPGTKVVLVDDATEDCTAGALRERFPQVDVVRAAWPAGDGYRAWRAQQGGLLSALDRYRFDVLLKLDPDALLTGDGLVEGAARRFAADPRLGALGCVDVNATGDWEWYGFERAMLVHELRWSAALRRLAAAARAEHPGARLVRPQGGVYLVRRAALDEARRRGLLPFRQPAWSFMAEDLIMGLVVQAAGYAIGSHGAPGEPIACAINRLPLELDELVAQGKLAIHSVKRGASGEDEAAVRAFFAQRR